MTVIGKQYEHFTGQALSESELKRKIERAVELGTKREFHKAIALFEQIPEGQRVPAVWNDLGVAYAGLDDQQRARAAFKKAQERSPDDQAARANLSRLDEVRKASPPKGIETAEKSIINHPFEPNDDIFHATMIPLNVGVKGTIMASDSVDYFKFTTPSPLLQSIATSSTSRLTTTRRRLNLK
jgi:hypothetical protein